MRGRQRRVDELLLGTCLTAIKFVVKLVGLFSVQVPRATSLKELRGEQFRSCGWQGEQVFLFVCMLNFSFAQGRESKALVPVTNRRRLARLLVSAMYQTAFTLD